MDILGKIAELKRRFIDSGENTKAELESWEKEVKVALILDELEKHDGIKMILEKLEKNIESLNSQLLSQKTTETERAEIFGERRAYEWLISLFKNAAITLKSREKEID